MRTSVTPYAAEFARLLEHIGTIGACVRNCSSAALMSQELWPRGENPNQRAFLLGDALHNLGHLGRAIEAEDPKEIADTCRERLADYAAYKDTEFGESLRQQGIAIFEAIVRKALAQACVDTGAAGNHAVLSDNLARHRPLTEHALSDHTHWSPLIVPDAPVVPAIASEDA